MISPTSLIEKRISQLVQLYLLIVVILFSYYGVVELTDGDYTDGLSMLLMAGGFAMFLYRIHQTPQLGYKLVQHFFSLTVIRGLIVLSAILLMMLSLFTTIIVYGYDLPQWSLPLSILTLIVYGIISFLTSPSTPKDLVSSRTVILAILFAGIVGGILGYLHPQLHVAVEQGQVLAHVIEYPSNDNAWFVYQAKLWNFGGLFSALVLSLGVTEVTLSIGFSVLVGVLFAVNVTLIGLSITRDFVFSVLLSFIVYLLFRDTALLNEVILNDTYGYPLMLINEKHTYGMLGLSYSVLVLAILALGRPRAGFFLLGFSPFIHPSLAVWLHITLALFILSDFRNLRMWIKSAIWVVVGYGISILTLIWQRSAFPIPTVTEEIQSTYLRAIIEHHATHGDFHLWFVSLGGAILVLAFVCSMLHAINRTHPINTRFLTRILPIIISVGIIGLVLTYDTSTVSDLIAVLLPNRYLTIVPYLFVPMAISLGFIIVRGGLTSIVSASLLKSQWLKQYTPTIIGVSRIIVLCVGIVLIYNQLDLLTKDYNKRYNQVFGLLETPVFQATAETTGILLVSTGMREKEMLQLYSNRPLLLNPMALDNLPYTLEAAPITAKILEDVYDVDFFNPPSRWRLRQRVSPTWQERTRDEWITLADDYGFTQVLVNDNMELQLPLVAENESGLRLYDVP